MADLYSSIVEKTGQIKANYLILSAILDLFIKPTRLKNGGEDPDLLKRELFQSTFFGEVLFQSHEGYSHEDWQKILSYSFSHARENGIDLSKDPNFQRWIVENKDRLNDDISSGRYSSYWQHPPEDYVALIEAGFISGSADPAKIYRRYSHIKRTHVNKFDTELIRSIACRVPDLMIEGVEDVDFVKNVAYPFRSIIYASLAEQGKLSKKAARKIRSDSSEESSDVGVKAIAANLHKFENATEVLSQIMDTKHFKSAKYLADHVPKQYLPFMAVCQDQRIREIVVKRMQGDSNV